VSLREIVSLILFACVCNLLQAQQEAVELGIDHFEKEHLSILKGLRVGLVTNPSGVDSEGRSTIEVLQNAPGVKLVALFGPEHGLNGKTSAGKCVKTYTDPKTGLKVYSLFGDTRKPTSAMLSGLDAIVYDIQDIGCRSYTYISTLGYVMQAAADKNIQVIVFDRPDPLGGMRIEGPRLSPKYRSFVGLYDIPYIYGLTSGELARWINRHYLKKPCHLTIIAMKNWHRNMTWEDTGLKWVPTSPNIPTIEAARGYVATGLLGEIGIENGANQVHPFEVIASEGLEAEAFAKYMKGFNLDGVQFLPYSFYPVHGRYRDVRFTGVRLKIDPKANANLTAIPFLAYPFIKRRFPSRNYFLNRTHDPIIMFDKINGTSAPRIALQEGLSPLGIVKRWSSGVERWKEERKPYLIYPE
jgi:uncharacterized protein YbbC (DUF1343 family)